MKYIFNILLVLITSILYYPVCYMVIFFSLIFILLEIIWFLKLIKDKEDRYTGIGINLLVITINDFLPLSSFKKVIINTFKD